MIFKWMGKAASSSRCAGRRGAMSKDFLVVSVVGTDQRTVGGKDAGGERGLGHGAEADERLFRFGDVQFGFVMWCGGDGQRC